MGTALLLPVNVLCEQELVKCFGPAGVRMALLVRPGACPAPAHTVPLGGAIEGDDTDLATFGCPENGGGMMLTCMDFTSCNACCPKCLA